MPADPHEALVEEVAKLILFAVWREFGCEGPASKFCVPLASSIIALVAERTKKATSEMREAPLDSSLDIYWGYLSDGHQGRPEDAWAVMHAASPLWPTGDRNGE